MIPVHHLGDFKLALELNYGETDAVKKPSRDRCQDYATPG
jgi:hypothetical protein